MCFDAMMALAKVPNYVFERGGLYSFEFELVHEQGNYFFCLSVVKGIGSWIRGSDNFSRECYNWCTANCT